MSSETKNTKYWIITYQTNFNLLSQSETITKVIDEHPAKWLINHLKFNNKEYFQHMIMAIPTDLSKDEYSELKKLLCGSS